MEDGSDSRVHFIEIIPVNPLLEPQESRAWNHFGRIIPIGKSLDPPDKVLLLSFNKASETPEFANLVNALSLIPHGSEEVREISIEFPEFFTDLKKLRVSIEVETPNHVIFLNLTPFIHHFHAILFRDAMESKIFTLRPYEILEPRWQTFNHVFVPNYFKVDLVDWEIFSELSKGGRKVMSLKQLQEVLELPGWNKNIKTIDQKLRSHLNQLVDQGLLDVQIGANGEKLYFLKAFRLNQ